MERGAALDAQTVFIWDARESGALEGLLADPELLQGSALEGAEHMGSWSERTSGNSQSSAWRRAA